MRFTLNRFIMLSFSAIIVAMAVNSSAHAATANGSAKARLVAPATLTKNADLDFGRVITGTTASTVTVNAQTGLRTKTGTAVLVGTLASRAQFTGTAQGGTTIRVTASSPTIVLTRVGGGSTITLNTLRVSMNGGAPQTLPRNYVMPASGTQSYAIGGRIAVAANKLAGIYSGTFALTMDYQ